MAEIVQIAAVQFGLQTTHGGDTSVTASVLLTVPLLGWLLGLGPW